MTFADIAGCTMNLQFAANGGAMTYAGATTFLLGRPALGANTADIFFSNANELPSTSAVTVTNVAGGFLNLNGLNQAWGSLAGNGPIGTTVAGPTLTVGGDNLSTVYSGIIGYNFGTIAIGGKTGTGDQGTANTNISLVKNGVGTLNLSGANQYTGTTTINNGTLLITGSIVSPVTVAIGGILGGSGTISNTVTVQAGGHLAPATTPTGFSLLTVTNNLSINNGAILDYNLVGGGSGGTDLVELNAAAGKTLTVGTNNSGLETLNITALNNYSLPAGTWTAANPYVLPILQATGGATLADNIPAANWSVNIPTTFSYSIAGPGDANGVANQLSLLLWPGNPSINWTGAANNGIWDTTSANWGPGNVSNYYSDGYNVTFDDTATGTTTISLNGATVKPASVAFANVNKAYTISGGTIADSSNGPTSLTKTQNGTVTLNNVNTFTGSTLVKGGNLNLGSNGTLASPIINVSAGAVFSDSGSLTVAGGPTVSNAGTIAFFSPSQTLASLAGAGLTTLNGTTLTLGAMNVTGTINGSGGLVYNTSGSTIAVSPLAAMVYSGRTTINGPGTLQATGNASLGSTTSPGGISLNNATLEATGSFATNNVLTLGNSASTVVVNAGQTLTLNSSMLVTGAGALTKNGGGLLQFGPGATLPSGIKVTATGGGTLDLGGNTHAPGSVTVAAGGSTIQNGTLIGSSYVFNGNATVSANLQGATAPLTVNSPAVVALFGTNTYGGATTINSGGTLSVTSGNLQALPGSVNLNGGNLAIGTTAGLGLTANFYTPDPGNGNLALFNSLSGVTTFTSSSGVTPAGTFNTANGTGTGLNFPDTGNGQAFTSIGYNGALNYTAVFTGYIRIPTTGTYYFSTRSDDGSMLFLDNNNTPVVSNNFYQGETTRASTAQLLSAGYHPITVAYYQGTGGGGLIAYSDSTGTNYIPNSQLSATIPTISYSNSVSLAANSSISPYGDVTMGGLSIGGNQLHIVAGNGVGLTFSAQPRSADRPTSTSTRA